MNIKSKTLVNLPFGSMLFTRQICFDGHEQTMYQYVFDKSSHFDIDQCDPFHWNDLENRIDMRNLMMSEGGASEKDANRYIRILTKKQWAKRRGSHVMNLDEAYLKYRFETYMT